MENKKGQLGNLQGIILTLIIAGILIGAGFLVLNGIRNAFDKTTNTVVNETIIPTDAGAYVVYNKTTANISCFGTFAVVYVTNETGSPALMNAAGLITSANYSFDPITGRIWNITAGSTLYNRRWNVTYTYTTGNEACGGVGDTIVATQTVPAFLPILIIVAIVGILLAIALGVFPKIGGSSKTAYV